ncbi:MAG: response regulator [Proteobacteria bacterium]|jgi:DNA-binding NtrC family response regulator|nr:response regulator [Pseudomonadota bacterium]
MSKILIVDDEIGIRELLSEILRDEGHDVIQAEDAAAARAMRNASCPDMVLLDIWMPDTDGITLLKEWAAAGQLTMPVVMMSGHGTIDTAVEATRIGAIDYLEKPIALQKLLSSVRRGLQRQPTVPVPMALTLAAFPDSVPLRELHRRLRQAAMQSRVILLQTGQDHLAELAARSLQTPGKPWLDLGTFDGVYEPTRLAASQGGQLYLPALERLSRSRQKNLAAIVDRLERYDLRLLVASNSNREELLAAGWEPALVELLFSHTLTGVPTLADIRDDLPELACRILRHLVDAKEVPMRRFSPATLSQLRRRDWHGGYGELYATIRSLAQASTEEEINLPEGGLPVPDSLISPISFDLPLREAREAFERMYFEHHLRLERGNITRLAQKTGLERTHLYRKLRQLGLHCGRQHEES